MIIPNTSAVIYNAVPPNEAGKRGSLSSNTVNTEVLPDAITKVIKTDKTFVNAGEIFHNTITITNNSSAVLGPTHIVNNAPNGASYIDGSVKINGVTEPNSNPITGVLIPNLNPGKSVTIEYDMQVNNPSTVNTITNSADFQFSVNDHKRGNVTFSESTNEVTINVISANLEVVKTVDKAFAVKGETLTYTITFTNKGNININDIYFTDNIPQGTTFVEKSVLINGQNIPAYRPDIGYSVANLPPNVSATTSFRVTID